MTRAASVPALQVHRYRTTDADEGENFIRQAYVDADVEIRGRSDDFRLLAETVQVGTCRISRLQHSMAVTIDVDEGLTWQSISRSRRATLGIDTGQSRHRFGTDDVLTIQPGVPYSVAWDSLDADIVDLDLQRAAAGAAAQGEHQQPFHFLFEFAISPVAAEHWRKTTAFVRNVALANAHRGDATLLADQLSELLVGAALTCFPHTATQDQQRSGPSRTSPASLRRATAWIDAHLDQPIQLGDVADAARVSPRALNLTFNRHLGTTPMGYVRQARLDRAHHDLRAASPHDGTTVTAVAARWGFYSLPRFGATYRKTYGQPPSHTLRQT